MMESALSMPKSGQNSPISGISMIRDFGPGMGPGQSIGHYSQQDVVDGYARAMAEELETGSVRLAPIETRHAKRPLSWESRLTQAQTNFVPLILTCDYHDRDRIHNASVVEFAGTEYQPLAQALCFALSEWGRCYVWGHRVSKPVVVLNAPRSYVCVKPFALNGPNAEDYLRRLDALGEALGRAIAGYLLEKNQGRTRAR